MSPPRTRAEGDRNRAVFAESYCGQSGSYNTSCGVSADQRDWSGKKRTTAEHSSMAIRRSRIPWPPRSNIGDTNGSCAAGAAGLLFLGEPPRFHPPLLTPQDLVATNWTVGVVHRCLHTSDAGFPFGEAPKRTDRFSAGALSPVCGPSPPGGRDARDIPCHFPIGIPCGHNGDIEAPPSS